MKNKQHLNKIRIIKELYFSGPLSCSDLCAALNKSLPFVTSLLSELVEEELVIDTGFAPSSGGRRPILYKLVTNKIFIVSVAVDQLVTRIALLDVQNNVVGSVYKYQLTLANHPNPLTSLGYYLQQFIETVPVKRYKIIGVGISMPGFIDIKKSINYSFLSTPDGTSIVEYLHKKLHLPIFIDNDSSLIALAQSRFGMAKNKSNAMVINIGWGVGLGMILNGQLYRGDTGFAGEFSHIPLFMNNKLCQCGKSGCLETETSLLVLIQRVAEKIKNGKVSKLSNFNFENKEEAAEQILRGAKEGDKLCIEVLSEIAYKIGRGVSILIHLFNPELILLCGRGALAGKIWIAPIEQAINEYCIPRLVHNTQVKVSDQILDSELIGAACLVMENYERVPISQYDQIIHDLN